VTRLHLKRGITKKIRKLLTIILVLTTLSTCIDPFKPNLKGTTSLLIVDALLTNENRSYAFKLSWTTQTQNEKPVMASGAIVTLTDQNRVSTNLTETEAGVYKTDSLNFLGETGNSYVLEIRTSEGAEYVSDTCTMYPVQPIDNIYFNKDQEFVNNGTEIQDGIRISLDSENKGDGKYLRWIYNEWWKFSVPNPKLYDYINENDIRHVEQVRQICYAFGSSDDITIKSTVSASSNKIEKQPILFIASDQSDRLLKQYYIEIKQLSLSKTEFEFWNHLKEINEGGSDIFEKQPYSIPGNIHSKRNPSEIVLGYFQVSAVEPKSIYIIPDDIAALNLPVYKYDCERLEVGPDDYPVSQNMTFDQIYDTYTIIGYIFIQPMVDRSGNLQKLVFTKPVCSICTVKGNLSPPDFWIDMESSQKKK
jgi:hypothetical protein